MLEFRRNRTTRRNLQFQTRQHVHRTANLRLRGPNIWLARICSADSLVCRIAGCLTGNCSEPAGRQEGWSTCAALNTDQRWELALAGPEFVGKVCRIRRVRAVILLKMSSTDQDLLRQFVSDHSQDAFTALVTRHLDLVYSAALRQVRSSQLAEEVCQVVFSKLASKAVQLAPETVLTAWLYQVTRHAAIDLVRQEARRRTREQLALEISNMSASTHEWPDLEPLLDDAMDRLGEYDRTALLLRYFENKSLREVGQALGASEDAAQKRVSRALERLREHLSKRRVEIGAAGLAALLSANAIQAAPAGLTASVAASAFAASAGLSSVVTAGLVTHTLFMTNLQKSILMGVTAVAVALGLHQALQASRLRKEVQTLRQQRQDQSVLLAQVKDLQRQRDQASNALGGSFHGTGGATKEPGRGPQALR